MNSSTRRLRIVVLLDSDMLIRHFVFSHALEELGRRHDVTFVFPGDNWRRVTVDPGTLELPGRVCTADIPTTRLQLWKRLLQLDQIRWRPGKGFRGRRKIYRAMVGWKASLIYTVLGLPGLYGAYQRRIHSELKSVSADAFSQLMDELRPDVLIHPSTFEGYFVNDFVLEAQRLGVPSILVMNSWDNPSHKQAMAGKPDITVVWGEQTVRHTERYMGIARERIRVLGAAQFDVFREPASLSREAFCREHGVDPSRTLVLYAGSSRGVDEFAHLQALEAAAERGELPDVTIVYRPHPWGKGGKNGERIADHPWRRVVIERSMEGYLRQVADGNQKSTVLVADYRRTHDVLASVDAVISPLSTIILESLLHDKPVMCLLPLDEASYSVQIRLGLEHFTEMFEASSVLVCRSTRDLVADCRALLSKAEAPGFVDTVREEAKFFVAQPEKRYAEALADLVEALVRRRGRADS